jgi:hypothetical protein
VAGIFHQPDSNSNYTFLASGTVIGSSTILTVFTGALDKLPRKIRGKGHNHGSIIVGVGLKSGKLEDSDAFSQISEVQFVKRM